MAYRILVGSIQQETNSFSPISSGIDDFDRAQGAAAQAKLSVSPLFRPDVEIIPSIYANAVPAGPMKQEVFFTLLHEMLSYAQNEIDGVFLYLHGALEVEGIGSGDAAIVQAVRGRVGEKAIISVAVDFHANIDPALLKAADIVCAYRTAPHVDMEETQQRAASLLMYSLENNIHPACAMVRVPVLITGDRIITGCQPACGFMREMERMESGPGMFSMSFCFGQPWVDTAWVGACVLAFALDKQTAYNAAENLARLWWEKRGEFEFEVQAASPEEALSAALSQNITPVFISDSGDNTTAGASSASLAASMYKRAHHPAYPIDAAADFIPECFSYTKDMKAIGNWHGIFFSVQQDKSGEYLERHRNVPESLIKVLKSAGIRNYTIWRHGNLLFACYLVADEHRMERVLEASPDYEQWRKEMESIISIDPVTGQKEWPMEQAFFLQ